MLRYAHRGYIDIENTLEGVLRAAESMDGVEIDVRYNTQREVVLCHDREKRNGETCELLRVLCSSKKPMRLMIDIKAFGTSSAERLARDVVAIAMSHRQHRYELCSFNEYCVHELLYQRMCSVTYIEPYVYDVGVISSGVPLGLFESLFELDFLSINYDVVHEEILEKIRAPRRKKVRIYAWTCNDDQVREDMEVRYRLDGIIYDI